MDGMKNHKNSGFTLVEIVVVMLIVAIIGTVVASRYTGSNANELIGQLAVIKSHLRYAQAKAMGSTSPDPISPSPLWYIRFQTTPAEYTLYKDGSKTFFPGEKDEDVTLKPGISLSGSTDISFDYLGRPYPNITAIGTQLTTVKTIVTSSAGNVEIRPETGFIP